MPGKLGQHTAASTSDQHNPRSSHVLTPTRSAAKRPANVPIFDHPEIAQSVTKIACENAKRRSDPTFDDTTSGHMAPTGRICTNRNPVDNVAHRSAKGLSPAASTSSLSAAVMSATERAPRAVSLRSRTSISAWLTGASRRGGRRFGRGIRAAARLCIVFPIRGTLDLGQP